ncbi:RPL7D, partial [Symbiodinium microadriaticum]
MAERYLISKARDDKLAAAPGLASSCRHCDVRRCVALVAERSQEKKQALEEKQKQRQEERAKLKERTEAYEKEYADTASELVKLRREAKLNGNFFVEPEAKLLFVVRIAGIIKMSPKPRKVLQLLRLKQLHNGVFLKVNKPILNMLKLVQPYVTYGYPSLKTVRELVYKRGFGKVNKQRLPLASNDIISDNLGKYGIHGMEDIIHEIYTVGPSFKQASNFLWPFKLSSPK